MAKKKAKSFAELEALIRDFIPDPEPTVKALNGTLMRVGRRIINTIRISHEWKDRSGKLNNSHYVKQKGNLKIALGNDAKSEKGAPYAKFLHDGTGIYGPTRRPIVPKVKPNLVFKLPSGQLIRTKSVNGVKPMRWLPKEWDRERVRTVREIQDTILKQVGF